MPNDADLLVSKAREDIDKGTAAGGGKPLGLEVSHTADKDGMRTVSIPDTIASELGLDIEGGGKKPEPKPREEDAGSEEDETGVDEEGGGEEGGGEEGGGEPQRQQLSRSERRRLAKARTRRERAELEGMRELVAQIAPRLQNIEKRFTDDDKRRIDEGLDRAKTELREAKKALRDARAGEDPDQDAIDEAEEAIYTARRRVDKLADEKDEIDKRPKGRNESEEREATPEEKARISAISRNFKAWHRENPRFEPHGRDNFSAEVRALDRELYNDGWDPIDPEYFIELDKRIDKAGIRPRRTEGDSRRSPSGEDGSDTVNNGQRRLPSAVQGTGRGVASTKGFRQFKVPDALIEELKQDGTWDDPVERDKVLTEWLKNQKSGRHVTA